MPRYSYMIVDPLATLGDDDTIRRAFDQIAAAGYEGTELNLTPQLADDLDRIAPWLEERDLVVPSFLTGAAYNEGLCLCSPDAGVRDRAVERLVSYLPVARRFGAILVVGLLQGLRSDEPDEEKAQPRIVDCLRQFAAQAVEAGVDFVIEPVNHLQVGFNNSVAEVRQLAARVDSPAIHPMVDTVHMNIEDSSVTQPIFDCAAALRHVHLCESNGGLFGSGHIDFAAVLHALDAIGYQRWASIKVYRKAAMEQAISSSIAYLRRVS